MSETSDLIQHDGKWYRKVKRHVDSTDAGKFFVECGCIRKVRSADTFCVYYEGGYTSNNTELALLEPLGDEFHVHEGTVYRKVARRAQVGELALIIQALSTHAHNTEDIGKIVKIVDADGDTCDGMIREHAVTTERKALYHDQYVVLEPAEPPQTAAPASLADDFRATLLRGTAQKALSELAVQGDRLRSVFPQLGVACANQDWAMVGEYSRLLASYAEQAMYWQAQYKSCGGR